jgi:hypothetical protein
MKPFFCHSGLDPESRKSLKSLDPGLRRDDAIAIFIMFFKGLRKGSYAIYKRDFA